MRLSRNISVCTRKRIIDNNEVKTCTWNGTANFFGKLTMVGIATRREGMTENFFKPLYNIRKKLYCFPAYCVVPYIYRTEKIDWAEAMSSSHFCREIVITVRLYCLCESQSGLNVCFIAVCLVYFFPVILAILWHICLYHDITAHRGKEKSNAIYVRLISPYSVLWVTGDVEEKKGESGWTKIGRCLLYNSWYILR